MGGELNTNRPQGAIGLGGTKTAKMNKYKTIEDNLSKSISPKKKPKEREKIRKKEKIAIVAKNKNEELKVMELIQEKNPKKIDHDLIYDSIGKHFFMQTLNDQARNEIIVNN